MHDLADEGDGGTAEETRRETSRLIAELTEDGSSAAERLLPLVYQELRALASSFFKDGSAGHTLQPTAVVHEAYFRLAANQDLSLEGRSHFFAVAARAMRNVLADHARARRTAKRGGDWERVTFSGIESDGRDLCYTAIDLDEALSDLAAWNERLARIVELRFFAGLKVKEAARVLGLAERTLRSEWQVARVWLRERLGAGRDS